MFSSSVVLAQALLLGEPNQADVTAIDPVLPVHHPNVSSDIQFSLPSIRTHRTFVRTSFLRMDYHVTLAVSCRGEFHPTNFAFKRIVTFMKQLMLLKVDLVLKLFTTNIALYWRTVAVRVVHVLPQCSVVLVRFRTKSAHKISLFTMFVFVFVQI